MAQYDPPKASIGVLGRVTALIADARTRELDAGPYLGARRIFRLPGGQMFSDSRLMVDSDGSRFAAQDGAGQPTTSLKLDGKYLDAASVAYLAFCKHYAVQGGFRQGDLAAVIYRDRLCYAFYGDASGHVAHKSGKKWVIDRAHYTFGEASIRVHEAIGHPVVYASKKSKALRLHDIGIDSDVLIVVFPGSGSGKGQNEAALEAHARPLWEALRSG